MTEQIPPTVFIAIGTIAAALISGTIAFLNLIISKEQTVSEFRQNWIDKLRDELSEYISSIHYMSVQAQILLEKRKKQLVELNEAIDPIQEHIILSSKLHHKIIFRLNPIEHRKLISVVSKLSDTISNPGKIGDTELVKNLVSELSRAGQEVLKKEWKRVKRGELTYQIVKYASLIFLVTAIGMAIYVYDPVFFGT